MNVGTVLELYTTIYGWRLYDLLWSVLSISGIALYPFLMMVYRHWREPASSTSSVSTEAVVSVQRMKWSLAFKTLILIVAVLPLSTLSINDMKYKKKDCFGVSYQELSHSNTGTTFDDFNGAQGTGNTSGLSLGGNTEAKVPFLFYLIMQLVQGTNRVIIEGLPCLSGNLVLDNRLRDISIEDSALKNEYHRFYSECHVPAAAKFSQTLSNKSEPLYTTIKTNLTSADYKDKQDRIFSLDSKFFKTVPGFYDAIQTTAPVDGFAPQTGEGNRDAGMTTAQTSAKGASGHPMCSDWWTDLRPRLLAGADFKKPFVAGWVGTGGLKGKLASWYTGAATPEELDQLAFDSIARTNPPRFTDPYADSDTGDEVIRGTIKGVELGALGVATSWAAGLNPAGLAVAGGAALAMTKPLVDFNMKLKIVKEAAPIMQSLVLMIIFMLLPLYLVFSEYRVESTVTALLLVFVMSFFTAMFQVAEYIDDALFTAMYPDVSLFGSIATADYHRLLLDMASMLLYVVAPMLLLYLVTMAGHNVSAAGGAGSGATNKIGDAGGGGVKDVGGRR